MESSGFTAAQHARARRCPLCSADYGEACDPRGGDHLARYAAAHAARVLTPEHMRTVLIGLDVIDATAVVSEPGSDPGSDPAARLAEVRAVLDAFDWETDDRQYALERIDTIVSRGRS